MHAVHDTSGDQQFRGHKLTRYAVEKSKGNTQWVCMWLVFVCVCVYSPWKYFKMVFRPERTNGNLIAYSDTISFVGRAYVSGIKICSYLKKI